MVYEAYNLSLINGTGMTSLVQTVNENLMLGWFGNALLLTIFVIIFLNVMHRTNNFIKSMGFSSLITAVLTMFLRNINIVSDNTVLIVWIVAAVSAALMIFLRE